MNPMTAAALYGVGSASTAEAQLAAAGGGEPPVAAQTASAPPASRAGLLNQPSFWLVAILAVAFGLIGFSVHVGVK